MTMITDAELGRMGFGPKARANIRGKRNQPRGGPAKYRRVLLATDKQEYAQDKAARSEKFGDHVT